MGADLNIFVGPYLKVKFPKKKINKVFIGCSNEKCVNHNKQLSSEFCPKCGTKTDKITVVNEKTMSSYEFYEDNGLREDIFYDATDCGTPLIKDYRILYPNKKIPNGYKFSESGGVYSFDIETIQLHQKWFNETYSKEIEILKKGCEEVFIEYGVVSNWN